jgi:quinol monooxygenase YgiN
MADERVRTFCYGRRIAARGDFCYGVKVFTVATTWRTLMYTATMIYHFKDDSFDAACEIWKKEIFEHAKSQPGFVRMQLLVARPKAMAIGTWEDNAHARAFMETGVFKRMVGTVQGMMAEQPQQTVWDLKYFAEK